MTNPKLVQAVPWAPHPAAAPTTQQLDADRYAAAANGTATCAGGWHFVFEGVEPGRFYRIRIDAELQDIESAREELNATAFWGDVEPDNARGAAFVIKDHLIPRRVGPARAEFSRVVQAPPAAERLTVRCTLRWTRRGRVTWSAPRVEAAPAVHAGPESVTAAAVTGRLGGRPKVARVQDNVEFYAALCDRACAETGARLVALPEIALTWGVGNALDVALTAPGPETDVFADIAARRGAHIAVGMYERDVDACYNSLILIGPDRSIEARYRKTHLAWGGEHESGLLPGDSFPTADTDFGRIGFNICMDSSSAESARMVGLAGADFLVLAIMGDLRADRLTPGPPIFNPDRWLAIQRTRALDNHLCMVIARNNAVGSCIINPRGDVLAWNEGDADYVAADIRLRDYRYWNGGSLRDVIWGQRRPRLYRAYLDEDNYGQASRG